MMSRIFSSFARKITIGLAVVISVVPAASGALSQVKVATTSPKKEGFLRELTQQPSLKLLPMADYRKADVIVNPPNDLALEKLREYLRAGGRILYYGKQPPAEISPFEESEAGKGGVAWVNPDAGEFARINWSGHLGGSGWKKVKKGTNVLAVLEDGTPYFVYHAVENGAVAYIGKKSDIWLHDEMLARVTDLQTGKDIEECFELITSFPTLADVPGKGKNSLSRERRSVHFSLRRMPRKGGR